jgi:hypothetical protein
MSQHIVPGVTGVNGLNADLIGERAAWQMEPRSIEVWRMAHLHICHSGHTSLL